MGDIREAQARLRGIAVRTRLLRFRLRESVRFPVRHLYLKPENLQPIGAFKIRGAYNKIASLSEQEQKRGVIT